ncbi:MAG: hypothetical protein EON47_06005 [Acetobacteraceae bacterium]|nr:MAG: hypothetical protein EON47_06005 [Acetobacteraceae bacterium]
MTGAQPAPIQLHLMPEAPGDDGTPRAALVLPAEPAKGNAPGRRAVTLLFGTVAAAVAEKRRREGAAA